MLFLFYKISMFCIVRGVFAISMHWQCVKSNSTFPQCFTAVCLLLFLIPNTCEEKFLIATGLPCFYQTLQQHVCLISKRNSGNLTKIDNTARELLVKKTDQGDRVIKLIFRYKGVQIARISLEEILAVLLAKFSTIQCIAKSWNTSSTWL
jgi:hypothetical protein